MIKSKISIINTGGTFNKVYNPLTGELDVPKDSKSLDEIISFCHNIDFEIKNIISKDSLEIDDKDREIIVNSINELKNDKIILIHGTDTMDLTALFIDERVKNKKIVFVGSMLPISINKVEATLNFSMALGFLNALLDNGVYISMHGSVRDYKYLKKNRGLGKFINC